MVFELDQKVPPSAQPDPLESSQVFDEHESNVRSYSRSFPAIFSRAKGAFLYDTVGRRYIDFLAGAGAMNFGHNHDAIKAALIEYVSDDGLPHGLDLYTSAKGEFLSAFVSQVLVPRGLDYKVQFTGPTGTNAVEAALKIARNATGRSGIFAFMGGYHGDSLGSLAATANRDHRRAAGVDLTNVTFMPFPAGSMADMDTLSYLRSVLMDTHSGVDLPAGIIVETLQAEGGVNVASKAWLQELRRICDDYSIVLIVDEVQTGVGRTGPYFSFERAGIVPDVVAVSKSISGSGQPMALTLLRPELDVWEPGEHTGTFRGNQLAFVTARVAIDLFSSERLEARTTDNARTIEAFLRSEVLPLDRRLQIRGLGMLWGLDTAAVDPTGGIAKSIGRSAFDNGLVIERVGRNDTVMKILPPLTIEPEVLREGMTILATSTKAALRP
jgi:diaminobutyrate-2-oxoglutarate transaminase